MCLKELERREGRKRERGERERGGERERERGGDGDVHNIKHGYWLYMYSSEDCSLCMQS